MSASDAEGENLRGDAPGAIMIGVPPAYADL